MHLDTGPYILPSEAVKVCIQEGEKRIQLHIELLQGGGGKRIKLYIESLQYKEEEESYHRLLYNRINHFFYHHQKKL